jgi:tetratricopeptide (TPR) repeat protein
VVIVGLIASLINTSSLVPAVSLLPSNKLGQQTPHAQANDKRSHELQIRFDQAIALLHAKQYEFAVTALEQVIAIAPKLPEAYSNMGFALLGLKQYEMAGESFNKATQLNLEQTNAYWGLALALEGLEDYEGALGAMRSYIHLSTPDDPFLPKARAALWEWEAKLGRIPGVKEQPDGSFKNDPG